LIACVDVDYRDEGAIAAALWFRGWDALDAELQATEMFKDVAEYEPGAFYKRELPCLLGVLAHGPKADVIVIDGYVWLEGGKAGLGAHLHRQHGGIVLGVAKTKYAGATDAVAVCRGESTSPLYVSAIGMTAAAAAAHIIEMHGPYRVPTLLKQVDSLARTTDLDGTGVRHN
jgi:deoxyribonuclease V